MAFVTGRNSYAVGLTERSRRIKSIAGSAKRIAAVFTALLTFSVFLTGIAYAQTAILNPTTQIPPWTAVNVAGGFGPATLSGNTISFNSGDETVYGDYISQSFSPNVAAGNVITVLATLEENNGGVGNHTFSFEILNTSGGVLDTQTFTVTNNSTLSVNYNFTVPTGQTAASLRITNTGATNSSGTDGKVKDVTASYPTPTVTIVNTANGAEQPNADGVLTVTQSALSTTDTIISLGISGTATSGTDFTIPASVTIPAGSLSQTINYSVVSDALVEGDETVIVTLTGVTSGDATPGTTNQATSLIIDNQIPVADAGPDQPTVASAATVTLDGSASSDPDAGDSIDTYAWTQTAGSSVTLSDPSVVSPTFTAPTLLVGDTAQTLTFSLIVTDMNGGTSVADTVDITVNAPDNVAPTADAGPDQPTVASAATVTLDGSASSDPDAGDSIDTYAWTQTAGSSVTLSDPSVVSPTFTAPTLLVGDTAQTLTFSLIVTDMNGGTSVADTVDITVNAPGNVGTVTFVINTPVDGTFSLTSPEPALNTTIVTSAGFGTSPTLLVQAGTYPVSLAVPAGFGVQSASCSSGGNLIDGANLSGSIVITTGDAIVCNINAADSLTETASQIGDFIGARSQLILQHQPDLNRRLERLSGRYSNDGGVSGFGFTLNDSNVPFRAMIGAKESSFSYSLRRSQTEGTGRSLEGDATSVLGSFGIVPDMGDTQQNHSAGHGATELSALERNGSSKQPRTGSYGLNNSKPLNIENQDIADVDPMSQRFDLWAEGRFSRFDVTNGEGYFGILHAGTDYLLTRNVLLGVGLQTDWTKFDGTSGNEIVGTGFIIGPYLTARLNDNFYFDARAGWGRSYNSISPFGTYTDSFNAERWLVTGAFIGSFDWKDWNIKPEARLSYFKETTDEYVDSLNVNIPSLAVSTGILEFGPTISKDIQINDDLLFSPFVNLKGIWTFEQENTATGISNQLGSPGEGLRARVEAGFGVLSKDGFRFSLSANYDGIGDGDFSSWGGMLSASKEF